MIFVVFALIAALCWGFWSHHATVRDLVEAATKERERHMHERDQFERDRKVMTAAIIARNSGEANRTLRDRGPRPDVEPKPSEERIEQIPHGL